MKGFWLDNAGRMKLPYMTDGEINAELKTATGGRRVTLDREIQNRKLARAAHVEELTRQQGRRALHQPA